MKVQLLLIALCVVSSSSTRSLASELHGQVVDEQGQPVAGARVDVATAAPKVGRGNFCPSCYLDCRKWTRSDERGEFVIRGLSPKLKFRILSTAPGKQTSLSELSDPDAGPLRLTLADFPADTPDDRILVGEVVSVEGVPLPGALIEPDGAKIGQRRWWGRVNAQAAVSDDEGKFKMLLGESFQGVDVRVSADEMAGTRSTLLKPGKEPHRIVVPEGAKVTGKLVHNGQPQADVEIAVVQTNRSSKNHFIAAVSAVTNEQGIFRFRALPASQQYAIFSPVGERGGEANPDPRLILLTKTFDVPDDGKTHDVGSLELTQGFDLAGKLVMTDKLPLPGGIKIRLGRNPAWDLVETTVGVDGRFAFRNLPTETYDVTVIAKGIELESSGLSHPVTGPNAIGVLLKTSIENLVIPLQTEVEPLANGRTGRLKATVRNPRNVDGADELLKSPEQKLFDRIFAEREEIISGKYSARGRYTRAASENDPAIDGDIVVHCAFDDELGLLRWEREEPRLFGDARTPDAPPELRRTGYRFIRTPEKCYRQDLFDGGLDRRGIIGIVPPDFVPKHLGVPYDVRTFGLVSWSSVEGNEGNLERTKSNASTFKNVELKDIGKGEVELSATVGEGTEQPWRVDAIWRIDTAHGDTVTYSQLDHFDGVKNIWTKAIDKTVVTWEERDSIWVPIALVLERHYNGAEKYEIELEWESVNEELSPDEFEPEALHVPPGTRLVDTRGEGKPIVVRKVDGQGKP